MLALSTTHGDTGIPVTRPAKILLVEDNPADVRLAEEALLEAGDAIELHAVNDGQAALDYVHQRGEYEDAARPDLILLDLNIPLVDGRQVLEQLKEDPAFASIPVIVLTTSTAADDIRAAYAGHANWYITKPVDVDSFFETVKRITKCWLSVVTLPPS